MPRTQTRKRRRKNPELERYGPYEWVPIQSVEPCHRMRYPHHFLRLFRSFLRHKGWYGRPLLLERVKHRRGARGKVRPGIRFVAWTGSHRLAAAFAAGVEWVPAVILRGYLWDKAHGKPKTVRLSETVEDEDRLAMVLTTGDEGAIRLMEREVPRAGAAKKAREKRQEEGGAPWVELGPHLSARVHVETEKSGETLEVVEVKHKTTGESRVFGREVLETLLALFPKGTSKNVAA